MPLTAEEQKDKARKRAKAYYYANKEKCALKMKIYKQNNKDAKRKKDKEWRDKNKEKLVEQRKAHFERSMKMKYVVVTTDKDRRGVFFGKLESEDGDVVELSDAQMCVYWSSDVKGVLGLAATGPTQACRISPSIPKIKLNGVTSVMHCSKEAVKAWEDKPWS